jgi:hypothetical protein
MPRFSPSREAANLPDSFLRKFNLYAIAASAAGVGTLALAAPAEGQIVYTPTHSLVFPHDSLSLALNPAGTADFVMHNSTSGGSTWIWDSVAVAGVGSNKVEVVKGYGIQHHYSALRLSAGAQIGPGQPPTLFAGTGVMASVGFQHPSDSWEYGYWRRTIAGYLGLQIQINGSTHYGWARLSVKQRTYYAFYTVVTGYAYEVTPNKPIKAGQTKEDADVTEHGSEQNPGASLEILPAPNPQPASVGVLALGAQGLPLWRTKNEVAESVK